MFLNFRYGFTFGEKRRISRLKPRRHQLSPWLGNSWGVLFSHPGLPPSHDRTGAAVAKIKTDARSAREASSPSALIHGSQQGWIATPTKLRIPMNFLSFATLIEGGDTYEHDAPSESG